MKQILIPTSRGPKSVLEENIIRIEASSNYCKIYFNNERPLVGIKICFIQFCFFITGLAGKKWADMCCDFFRSKGIFNCRMILPCKV